MSHPKVSEGMSKYANLGYQLCVANKCEPHVVDLSLIILWWPIRV